MGYHPVLHNTHEFAKALDNEDYPTAGLLMAEDCKYDTGEAIITGREAILTFYQANCRLARSMVESIEYRSEIIKVGISNALVRLIDVLTIGGERHTYQSLEKLTLGTDYLIIFIEHQEIAGEQDKLVNFLERHGIEL